MATESIPLKPRVIALGLFDGVHCGHRAVISTAARIGGGHCAVYTFLPQTITTKPGLRLLCLPDQQQEHLRLLGADELFQTDFSAVRDMKPIDFVDRVLLRQLGATAIVCGYNYRFGRGGQGDAALLQTFGRESGITVTVVPPVSVNRQPVSSTAIREAISNGDMISAAAMLGHRFCLRLAVSDGQHLGRTLGIPTINQLLPAALVQPRFGVYASLVEVNGAVYTGVTNIGVRPTVGADSPLAETWIDGFSGDLYGKTVDVYPIFFLRPEQKFHSLDALKAQIRRDSEQSAALLGGNLENALGLTFYAK